MAQNRGRLPVAPAADRPHRPSAHARHRRCRRGAERPRRPRTRNRRELRRRQVTRPRAVVRQGWTPRCSPPSARSLAWPKWTPGGSLPLGSRARAESGFPRVSWSCAISPISAPASSINTAARGPRTAAAFSSSNLPCPCFPPKSVNRSVSARRAAGSRRCRLPAPSTTPRSRRARRKELSTPT